MKVRIEQKCEMYETGMYEKYESSKSVKNRPNWQHIPTNAANALLYSPTSVTTQAPKTIFNFYKNTCRHCGLNPEKGRWW